MNSDKKHDSAPARPARRAFLERAVGACVGGAVAIPAAAYLLTPLKHDAIRTTLGERPLGPVSAFKRGEPTKVSVRADRGDAWIQHRGVPIGSVWVLKTGDQPAEFSVWSTICPHLGCAIDHQRDEFKCPCHNSVFALDGTRKGEGNPSPRDMDALTWRVDDTHTLLCTWVRYKTGESEKIEV